MNIILFGPPGSGKGTQGDKLSKNYNLFKVSTGDLLREEIKRNTELGKDIKKFIKCLITFHAHNSTKYSFYNNIFFNF